ncbi:ATP-dependent RecD-like DNA helicase [Caproiciproducens galactitolivorans]|uniref:ATP-dependent RecD2 DNA helicase n=1 Tax=Caproiciproducens galactitolivorans TaxID=642589 RepID=A0ABT4BV39_9FIRM|nr:ATP-dependent RecD-like DNA helicase [Caproiciproducens galactitolivorans]MCY1714205.1 ATP-dependent RecD-like DNA helicase [Caproiciproducens galactitolivorans]
MKNENLLEMTGSVEQVIFKNEKNGYAIIEINNGEELVTVVGIMPLVSAGEELRVVGNWINNPNYGTQFKAEAFERSKPSTTVALLKYLASGAIKGIGPSTAGKIVDAFGMNTLDIIEKEPERLCEIKGITKAKVKKISEEFQKTHGIKEIMLSLGSYGISPEESVRVWKYFGPESAERVQEDPYCLCGDGIEIEFDRADGIAASLERPQDDRCRIRAGILHVLKHNIANGHTCLPADKLLKTSTRMLGIAMELATEMLEELKADASIISAVFNGREYIFTPKLYRSEVYSAGRLQMMLHYPAQSIIGVDDSISAIEEAFQIQYADGQKQAIKEALLKGILILTGGPGTGKTTTLNAIIKILEEKGEKVLLAAPTGRAAKRMSELTGQEAKTIHRMLQVEWDENDLPVFAKNEKNLLECDALVIDELSMVDTNLFEAVLRALPLGSRLIMVGDCDQLPSVGPGNVLRDLIVTNRFPVVQLDRIFRQSMQSLIITNAHRIVKGQMPELADHSSDFFFLPSNDPSEIRRTIVELCVTRLPASYGYSPLTDIQVLSPGRKGELGTMELNKRIQAAVNPPDKSKKEVSINGILFREGDKVMQVKNNYNLSWSKSDGSCGEGVFNGDLGILCAVDRRASTLTVLMDDRVVLYELETAAELELAYAMTVHKSQGNEFPAVVMPMYLGAPQLSYRNLLYTAITRARSLLILVGTRRTIQTMIDNNKKTRRYTGLSYFLTEGAENEE